MQENDEECFIKKNCDSKKTNYVSNFKNIIINFINGNEYIQLYSDDDFESDEENEND